MTFAISETSDSDVVRLDFPPSSTVQMLVGWQTWLTETLRYGRLLGQFFADELLCSGADPVVDDAIKILVML